MLADCQYADLAKVIVDVEHDAPNIASIVDLGGACAGELVVLDGELVWVRLEIREDFLKRRQEVRIVETPSLHVQSDLRRIQNSKFAVVGMHGIPTFAVRRLRRWQRGDRARRRTGHVRYFDAATIRLRQQRR